MIELLFLKIKLLYYWYFKSKLNSSSKINFDKDSLKYIAPASPIQLLFEKKFLIITKVAN